MSPVPALSPLLFLLLLTQWAASTAPRVAAAAAAAVPVAVALEVSGSPPAGLQAGLPLNLSVSLQALPGLTPIPTADFKVAHDQILHIVGVGQDLDTFLHWHPAARTPTAFISKNVVFPKAGTFLIAVDGLLAAGPVANSTKLAVPGIPPMSARSAAAVAAAATDNPAVVTVRSVPLQRQQPAVSLQSLVVNQNSRNVSGSSNSSSSGNAATAYTVTVFGPQGAACKPGSPTTYVWTLTHKVRRYNTSSSRTVSQPVNDLRLYYGAPMHLAVVNSNLSHIEHVHGDVVPAGRPLSTGNSSSSNGNNSSAGGHAMQQTAEDVGASHAGHGRKLLQSSNSSASAAAPGVRAGSQAAAAGPRFGPTLKTEVVFPAKGRYLLVGQVARGNKLILMPVVVSCAG